MATQVKPPDPPARARTTLSRKNQITLPISILREAGFKPGDRLEVSVEGRRIVLRAVSDVFNEIMDRYAGSIQYPPNYLEDLRNEWDR
jgi:AbrB family looped-hinge helix DNA binding protein